MDIKIKSILLWPKNKEKKIREITFELDKINVITGKSQTGKSALIPIIDYCLGSSKCTIPVGMIRTKTDWFGVLLQMGSTQLLLARKEPGNQEQTSMMYIKEGQLIDIPKDFESNTNTDLVKNKLNQLAGLTNLEILQGENDYLYSSFNSRPSIRDMSAFEFQPQHIIANPYTLFFKADTYEHQEKLKTIFPLVLGVIDNEIISFKHELKDLEIELKRRRREMENRENILESWKMELKALYSLAKELGLLSNAPFPDSKWTFNDYLEYLRKVPMEMSFNKLPSLEIGVTDRVTRELTQLNLEEREISHLLETNRIKLSQLYKLRESTNIYRKELDFQENRLHCIGWFEEKIKEATCCPFCGSIQSSASSEIGKLAKVAKEVKEISLNINESNSILDKEIKENRKLINDLEKRLNVIREHRELLESKSKKAKDERQTIGEVYRFIGKLEQSISNWEKVQIDSELSNKISELENKINELKLKINLDQEKEKLRGYLSTISSFMARYAKEIGVERPDDIPELDVKNLSLTISSSGRRKDYLWEIGSGANWMGYHISALLALHEHFVSLKHNHVPQFLVIDQPSQVYFPERWPEDEDPKTGQKNKVSIDDDDIVRVRKIFKTLSDFLKYTDKKVQIIVIEHADEITWNGVNDIHLVERWRDNEALIPKDWIDD